MSPASDIYVNLEFTPNPNTLKFTTSVRLLAEGAANFTSKEQTQISPLAARLFDIEGVQGVLISAYFVTVTKSPNGSWETLSSQVPNVIENHLNNSLPIMSPDWKFQTESVGGDSIEAKIKAILDKDIRPAVAMDGGDIEFSRYENGTVYLLMHGSCKSCPSAVATLKDGVEQRLKAEIPEIVEVINCA